MNNLDTALAAYDAVVNAGGSPASGACAAASVLGITPVDALNLMMSNGAFYWKQAPLLPGERSTLNNALTRVDK